MPATHFSTGQFSYFGLWFTRQSKSLFLIQGSATSPDPVSDLWNSPTLLTSRKTVSGFAYVRRLPRRNSH